MKRMDLLNLWNIIPGMKEKSITTKLSYALIRNTRLLEPEIKTLQELTPKFPIKFNTERLEILNEICEKDEEGRPLKDEQGNFKISDEKMEDWKNKFSELQEKHKDDLKDFEEKEKKYYEFLDEESDIQLYKISIDDMPVDLDMETVKILEVVLKD